MKTIREEWLTSNGVFETLRTYDNQPFALEEHLSRLALGVDELGIRNVDLSVIRGAIAKELSVTPQSQGHLRIVVSDAGEISILHQPYKTPKNSIKCLTMHRTVEAKSYKSTDYQWRFELRSVALGKGLDDVILISPDDYVIEASTCNLIALTDRGWITPTLATGCLPGVTRKFLMKEFGVQESPIKREELLTAKSVALTSSLREIQNVEEVDGKIFLNSRETEALKIQFHSWILGNLAL